MTYCFKRIFFLIVLRINYFKHIHRRILLCLLFICLLGLCNISCSRQPSYSSKLLEIDRVLTTNTDSAFSLLTTIDSKDTLELHNQALYNLLMIEAREKLNCNDTIIPRVNLMLDVFKARKDHHNTMRTLFYKGTTELNARKPDEAILSLMDAVEEADTSEYLYLGKLHDAMSCAYNIIDDGGMQVEEAGKSLKYYEKLDSQVFINYAKLWLAMCLCNSQKGEQSIRMVQEVYPNIVKSGDQYLIQLSLRTMGDALFIQGKYGESIAYYDSLESSQGNLSLLESSIRLKSLIKVGALPDTIEVYANRLIANHGVESLPNEYYLYIGDYKKAYETLKSQYGELSARYNKVVTDKTHLAVNRYNESNIIKKKMELKLASYQFQLVIMIFVVVLLAIFFLSREIVLRRKRNRDRLLIRVALISDFVKKMTSEEVGDNKEDTTLLDNVKNTINQRTEEPYLIYSYFRQIQQFYDQFYSIKQNPAYSKSKIADIDKAFNNLKDDESLLREMEEEIDRKYDGLLKDVYGSIRKMRADQRRMMAYLIFGLSPVSIACIMDLEMTAFYSRKHRIKDHINKSSSPRKNELMVLAHL